jgi:peptidoglycan/LPS O-acetylase OafA/YrhL
MASLLTPPGTPVQGEKLLSQRPAWTATLESIKRTSIHVYHRVSPLAIHSLKRLQPWMPTRQWRRNSRLRPTAYLDGLRGFAALLVYILHHQLWAHDSLNSDKIFENAFGYEGRFYFAQFPGIRTFFSGGHFSVTVFFVISGYVLSAKPLALLHSGDHAKLADNLASALFRRWIRLYIPILATTFVFMAGAWLIHGAQAHYKPHARFRDEFWDWYNELGNFSFIFKTGGVPWVKYNFHAWTIPLEFKGSIVIYTCIMAFSRLRRNARIWLQLGLIYYFLYVVDGWYCSCFLAGMLLADIDIMAEHNQLPEWMTNLEPYKDTIFRMLFIIAMYLGGVPAYGLDIANLRDAPGWYYLSFLRPQSVYMPKSYYLVFAGIFLVAATQRISWLRSFFELPFNQYLGKVSYAFYLVHGPVLWTIGDRVYAAVGWTRATHSVNVPAWVNAFRLPSFGPVGLEFNFLCAHLVLFPLTLWVAKMATNAFDDPAIKFARWLYEKLLAPEEESEKVLV